jgi:hypothetical protein
LREIFFFLENDSAKKKTLLLCVCVQDMDLDGAIHYIFNFSQPIKLEYFLGVQFKSVYTKKNQPNFYLNLYKRGDQPHTKKKNEYLTIK